jgi:hypothetical protein
LAASSLACIYTVLSQVEQITTVAMSPGLGLATGRFSTTLPNAKLPTIDDAYKKTSVQELSSLKGKVAVVTGGGRGIGLALARGIVENGGDVLLDALKEPHPDFHEMQKEFPESKIQFYQ